MTAASKLGGLARTQQIQLTSLLGSDRVNRIYQYAFIPMFAVLTEWSAGEQIQKSTSIGIDMNKLFAALIAAVFAAGSAFAADAKKDEKKTEAKPATTTEAKKDAAPAKAEAAPAKKDAAATKKEAAPAKTEAKKEAAPVTAGPAPAAKTEPKK
jgi:hypothetical protein